MGQEVQEIWQGPAFVAARHKLYNGLRDFGPCLGCDDITTRVGLLPDKQGIFSEVFPNQDDLVAIEKATSYPSYTEPNLRPWELANISHGGNVKNEGEQKCTL